MTKGGRKRRTGRLRKRQVIPGARPGQLVATPGAAAPEITAIGYGPEAMEEVELARVADLRELTERFPRVWVNVTGLGDAAVIEGLGDLFGVHRLALEDVLNVPQRPKVEAFGEQLFVVLQMLSRADGLEREQIGLFVGESFVLTFQEKPGDALAPVRERMQLVTGRLRQYGSDYLAYAIVDLVVDRCFPLLEEFLERLEGLEDELRSPGDEPLARIREARADLLEIRRAVAPLREVTRGLMTHEGPLVRPETLVYLRDCHDHAVEAAEQLDACREVASSLMQIHLSSVSNQANEVMKVLTIIATIFMPLSFLAGVYGMNFDRALPGNMPELGWPYGYALVLSLMAAVGLALVVWFRRKGWF